jgi:DNA-binding NarL/FixJ family response regulator
MSVRKPSAGSGPARKPHARLVETSGPRGSAADLEPAPASGPAGTRFTPREMQIALLVCQGRLNKQIAAQLALSEYTVATYIKQIYLKCNVHRRTELTFQLADWARSVLREQG